MLLVKYEVSYQQGQKSYNIKDGHFGGFCNPAPLAFEVLSNRKKIKPVLSHRIVSFSKLPADGF